MAKASSPIRLQSSLMEAATVAGTALHRSASEQIEYWADLGRAVASSVDADSLLAVRAGLARVSVEKIPSIALNVDSVFQSLDRDRESGALGDAIAAEQVRYQASSARPGLLEQVQPDGRVCVGQFVNGVFQASENLPAAERTVDIRPADTRPADNA